MIPRKIVCGTTWKILRSLHCLHRLFSPFRCPFPFSGKGIFVFRLPRLSQCNFSKILWIDVCTFKTNARDKNKRFFQDCSPPRILWQLRRLGGKRRCGSAPQRLILSRWPRPNERFSPLYAAVTFVDGVILPGETKRQTLSKRIVFKIPYSKSGKIPLPAIKLSFIIQQFCLKEKDSEALSEN